MDTSPKCPIYGKDFKRMIATMCVNTLGSGVMLLVKKRFKRRHQDQIHKLRKADFESSCFDDEEDENGNPIKKKVKTRLALVQEFNELEDQTEAAIMIQALARGYIVRVRLGAARQAGMRGYIGGAIFAGLGKVVKHGQRATAGAAKAMAFVPGGTHVVRGIGGLAGGLAGGLLGGVKGVVGGVTGGLGVLSGGLGIIPKSKRRKRDPSRGGTVLPPPGAGDVLFPVYPLDPFSTEELMQPGAQYGNVSHFTAEVELGLRGRDVVVMSVHAPSGEEDGAAAAPPSPSSLLAEWPLSQVANVSAQKDEEDPEMMEMVELEIKHIGLFLFEADKADPIAALISRRAAEAAAVKGGTSGGDGGGGGGLMGLGGMMGKAKGALSDAGAAAGKGVRLWV